MASAPQAALPLFYKDLMPLNSRDHANWRSRSTENATWMVGQHAIPLTAEEFVHASRNYPIVFSNAESPVPLALMGLNEGVNTFFDEEGKLTTPAYLPAYARRYPFMLAKLTPDTEELSLCFDPTTDLIGEFADGNALFDGDQPSEACKATLDFCRNFEEAGFRTQAFVEELTKHGLLMDGEVSIQQQGNEQPFIYRGFKMVDQEKLRDLRGDVLRTMNQNGMLGLIFAHLFSLELMSEVFGRQVQQGKGPVPVPAT
ncbi:MULTISPECIES: SapC family protein [unclassified Novosphingobium]|uniref:SapC family protein n=1 Tax=unclassified Novosphingobium TaxID=2644732 RepID=UPI000ED12CDE|nr:MULTISPECIES: SapC family protein [unclassified Novosphingobium]HCF24587.1 multidrug transporter [Novosphingobium sp.]HQV03685.1 SapC family protein [Novosphingobium sp.]